MTASVDFKMVEFKSQKNKSIEYEMQIDETSNPEKQLYNMIIGSNLLWNMGVNILFKERQVQWNNDKLSLKEMSSVHNVDMFKILHSIYTNSPLLQEAEER